jgi:hypothetical protein
LHLAGSLYNIKLNYLVAGSFVEKLNYLVAGYYDFQTSASFSHVLQTMLETFEICAFLGIYLAQNPKERSCVHTAADASNRS